MVSHYFRKYATTISIVLFAIIYAVLSVYKPAMMFSKDGDIREFGVGQSNKTIMPLWLVSLLLGIMCYFVILVASSTLFNI